MGLGWGGDCWVYFLRYFGSVVWRLCAAKIRHGKRADRPRVVVLKEVSCRAPWTARAQEGGQLERKRRRPLCSIRMPALMRNLLWKGPVNREENSPGHLILRDRQQSGPIRLQIEQQSCCCCCSRIQIAVLPETEARGLCVPLEFLACGILPYRSEMAIGTHGSI